MQDNFTQFISFKNPFRTINEIKGDLENGSDEKKFKALKELILLHMNGMPQPKLLIYVIRYVLPSQSKDMKKLLMYYWEIFPMRTPDGKLREEIILVCEQIRKDLEHPNEFIRGATLRLLSKIKEGEILEPLIPPILENLECDVAYVRRNAVLTVYSMAKDESLSHLVSDAGDIVYNLLLKETDVSCIRNAFLMLQDLYPEKGALYLRTIIKNIKNMGHLFQLQILRLLKRICRKNPGEKHKYLRIISSLISSKNNSVLYQCANTLVELSSSPVAIRTASKCYTKLILNEQDHNIKLIVFDRIIELKKKYPKYVKDVTGDILRILKCSEFSIKKKVVENLTDLVSFDNSVEVLTTLKNELVKSIKNVVKKKEEQQFRVKILQECRKIFELFFEYVKGEKEDNDTSIYGKIQLKKGFKVHFQDVLKFLFVFLDFLGDTCAEEIILLTKEVIGCVPEARGKILEKLYSNLCDIKEETIYRHALWILSEYSSTKEEIVASFDSIYLELNDLLPKMNVRKEKEEEGEDKNENEEEFNESVASSYSYHKTGVKVAEDGTYVTQTGDNNNEKNEKSLSAKSSLSTLIEKKHFFLYVTTAISITKLMIKLRNIFENKIIVNKCLAQTMLALVTLNKLGNENKIDQDSQERIKFCLRLLLSKNKKMENIFLVEGKKAFVSAQLRKRKQIQFENKDKEMEMKLMQQPDKAINITQLRTKTFDAFAEEDTHSEGSKVEDLFSSTSRLNQVHQLTGCSDNIYAEASVNVHDYDIVLDVVLYNCTSYTLENISVELSAMGDLEVCETPQISALAPKKRTKVGISIKITSTETGTIFGNIVYTKMGKRKFIVLSDLFVNIMDYIYPSDCSSREFRKKWRKFVWENKILVKLQTRSSLESFVRKVSKISSMKILSRLEKDNEDETRFLSANMYSASKFGESALLNCSLEKIQDSNSIEGIVRIRSKTQGIARSLGRQVKKLLEDEKKKKSGNKVSDEKKDIKKD